MYESEKYIHHGNIDYFFKKSYELNYILNKVEKDVILNLSELIRGREVRKDDTGLLISSHRRYVKQHLSGFENPSDYVSLLSNLINNLRELKIKTNNLSLRYLGDFNY